MKRVKYLFLVDTKEPREENIKKAAAIEKERTDKGEAFWPDKTFFPMHVFLTKPGAVWAVDTDKSEIAKWVAAYKTVLNFKIIPLIERSKWEELNT